MKARLVPIVLLLALAGCSRSEPYAFRLMVPPAGKATIQGGRERVPVYHYLPFWFWEEIGLFERFTECEQARKKRVEAAREFLAGKPLEKGYVFAPKDEGREVGMRRGKKGTPGSGVFLLGEEEKRAGKRLNEDGYVLYPSAEERREHERLLSARCVPLR